MGKDKKKQQAAAQQSMTDVSTRARAAYDETQKPSQLENEMAPISRGLNDQFDKSAYRQQQDYGDIMSGYKGFANSLSPSFERVNYKTPEEFKEGMGYMRETMPGYRDFANTGGYSGQDIQELRARSVAPIRSAYGNTMMEMDRARSLGGNAGSPNYIAAASRAQRELPGQMADAMTGINAELARDVREGKKFGLTGMSGVGGNMAGLAGDDAGRQLSADINNQQADLSARSMYNQAMLGSMAGQTSLYGTTPAMAQMFGRQAMDAYGTRASMESNRRGAGLGLLDAELRASGAVDSSLNANKGAPWWQTALKVGGTVAPYVAQYYGGRNGGGTTPMYATDIGGEAVY